MPRLPLAGKAMPWIMVLDAAITLRRHWGYLDEHDRRELGRIVKKSQGRPGNLSKNERNELARIVRRLDLLTAGRKLVPLPGRIRRRGR